MRDIPDPIFTDSADTRGAQASADSRHSADSPLRAWSMWGGWGALGVVCAAGVAHAVSLVGRTVARPS
jgi:hypothetical protein